MVRVEKNRIVLTGDADIIGAEIALAYYEFLSVCKKADAKETMEHAKETMRFVEREIEKELTNAGKQ